MGRDSSIERQRRALELLDDALELDAGERLAYLEEHCDDPELRRQVLDMLADEASDGALEQPLFDIHGHDPSIGRRIGSYRLIRLIERGGMGSVYLAERQDFDQQVALKLIRRGLDLDEVLVRRFQNERQILARLDHPAIARLLDGGTTEDQLPFFVMELVEGEPIDRYCRRHGLSIEAKLRLFVRVCGAVQYAHQNLVIHRDLKPGNVLITEAGEPKLLDFGIAKLLDQELAARPLATETGEGPMTLRYASPEQIRLGPITTASDVYSLGVLLYELLTGSSPYRLEGQGGVEVARAVCEQEPERPSTAVRRREEEAAAGGDGDEPTEPRGLRRRLVGDLDSIVLRALAKEPSRRYGSAQQLAADIERHLEGLPVMAREGTPLYLLGKTLRRHRLAFGVTVAFLLLSLGFGVVSFRLFLEAEAARLEATEQQKQAEEQNDRADAVVEFLKGLFKEAGPDASRGQELTAFDLLSRGEKTLGALTKPEDESELAGTLGGLYFDLGDYESAQRLVERALEAARLHSDVETPEVATWLSSLGVVLEKRGRYEDAEEKLREALALRLDLGQRGASLFRVQTNLAGILTRRGEYDEAAEMVARVLDDRIAIYGPEDHRVAASHRRLAAILFGRGKPEAAERHLREALGVLRRLDEEPTAIASVLDLLSQVVFSRGRAVEAEQLAREALTMRLGLLGDDHDHTAISRKTLGVILTPSDPAEARALLEQARDSLARSSSGGWRLAEVESALGALLAELGLLEEARYLLEGSHRRLSRLRGPGAYPTRIAEERLNRFDELSREVPAALAEDAAAANEARR